MKIALGSDKSGYPLKEAILSYLSGDEAKAFFGHQGISIEVADLGTTNIDDVHPYYRVAADIAPLVAEGNLDRAILICGTGAGMNVVANKFKGVQAVVAEGVYTAKMARAINGAKILCMGGWVIAPEMGVEMVKAFLTTDYLEDLEEWRKDWLTAAANKVAEIEVKNFK